MSTDNYLILRSEIVAYYKIYLSFRVFGGVKQKMNFVFDLITSTSRAKTIESNYLVVSANLDHELVVALPKGFSLRCFSCKGEIF